MPFAAAKALNEVRSKPTLSWSAAPGQDRTFADRANSGHSKTPSVAWHSASATLLLLGNESPIRTARGQGVPESRWVVPNGAHQGLA